MQIFSIIGSIFNAVQQRRVIMAYSYACADCEGMEACPGKVIAETEDEVWKLMELHAKIAHDEDASGVG